jgi:hypothetical protein
MKLKDCASAMTAPKKTSSMGYKSCLILCLLALMTVSGCKSDEDLKDEVRAEVRAARYEKAVELASRYFAADKLNLMVMLDYIAFQKEKASKQAYRPYIHTEVLEWERDRPGGVSLVGRIANRGDRTMTGFAVQIRYLERGAVTASSVLTRAEDIGPGKSRTFGTRERRAIRCDHVSVDLIDFALKK